MARLTPDVSRETLRRAAIVIALSGAGVLDPMVLAGQMATLAIAVLMWGLLGDVSRETSQDHTQPLESQNSPEPVERPA